MKGNYNRLLLLLLLLILIVSGIWVVEIVNGGVPLVDRWTRGFVERLGNSVVYQPFLMITELGSRSFLVPFVVVMAILLWILLKNRLAPLVFAGGTFVTHLFNKLIKSLVERERPSISVTANAEGHSFPSGHAMVSMVCYGLLAYFLIKRMKSRKAILTTQIFFSLIVLLIGISRYVINVHYLTDVVVGFAIGYICLIGLIYLYETIQKYRASS